MKRGTMGVVAGAMVVGLFLLGGVAQRWRNAESAAAIDVAPPGPRAVAPQEAMSTEPARAASLPAPRDARLVVAFQLDRALTQGHYLGERWVSPPVFRFAQAGDRYVVRARLQQVDARGERVDVSGDWASGDPQMLAITRLDGGQVQLDVIGPGRTELIVAAGGQRKILQVEARRTPDAMDVAFRQ